MLISVFLFSNQLMLIIQELTTLGDKQKEIHVTLASAIFAFAAALISTVLVVEGSCEG